MSVARERACPRQPRCTRRARTELLHVRILVRHGLGKELRELDQQIRVEPEERCNLLVHLLGADSGVRGTSVRKGGRTLIRPCARAPPPQGAHGRAVLAT